jgi:dTDP-4-dehydrorhamnose reductase
MRVLLIGADGLVGRHLRAALEDVSLTCTTRRGDERTLPLDITDASRARSIIREARPDTVILAAADAYVERCEREPERTRRVNVDAARIIGSECDAVGARLVVFSSDYVFDGSKRDYAEEDPRHPINEYGRQKVALEDLALGLRRGLVCRTSAVFGHDPKRKNFVAQLVDRLRRNEHFDVPSDQSVTPTYAPSLAASVRDLVTAEKSGIFHVAGPRVIERTAFARMIAKAYSLDAALIRPRPTAELGTVAPRPARCGLATRKLRSTLGRSLADPEDGLRELAARD